MSYPCIQCQRPIELSYKACPHCGEVLTDFIRESYEKPIDGKYKIISRLGRGGMGEVYKVLHVHLNAVRVIKLMRPNLTGDTEAHDRFAREARLATRISHPNVATLHDFSTLPDGSFYMVWEFIEGKTLTQLIRENGRLSPLRTATIAIQALYGLDAIHRAGIIHRDISPDNIMLAHDEHGDERIKIIDLGIAKTAEVSEGETQAGMFVGKWRYCSPEHLGMLPAGERIDGRADLYSFGIVMYEMLTGAPPFVADGPQQYYLQHMRETPKPFSIANPSIAAAPALEALIFRSLEKDREKRFGTAREFAAALENILPTLIDRPIPTAPGGSAVSVVSSAPTQKATAVTTPGATVVSMPQAITQRDSLEVPKPAPALPADPPQRSFAPLFIGVAAVLMIVAAIGIGLVWKFVIKSPSQNAAATKQQAVNRAAMPIATPHVVVGVPATESVNVAAPPTTTATTATTPTTATTAPALPSTTAPTATHPSTPPPATATQSAAPVVQTETESAPAPEPQRSTASEDERSRIAGLFHRGGHAKALVDSEEFRSGAFQKGLIGNYNDMVADPTGNVEWAWVAPGVKLRDHKIRVGAFRNMTGVSHPALKKNLEISLQSDLNDLTEDATGPLLTTEGAIYWAEAMQAHRRGVGVEVIFRDPSGRVVAKIRHHAIKRSLEVGAEEVAGNIYDFVKDQE